VVMSVQKEETREHVALRLAAFALFWGYDPKAELSLKHPALVGQEFRPDLIALNEGGEIVLWLECGNVSLNKLDKLTRRYPSARLAVLKATAPEARRMRRDLTEGVPRQDAIEIFAWPGDSFKEWMHAVGETVTMVGETTDRSLNLVINDVPVAVDLEAF